MEFQETSSGLFIPGNSTTEEAAKAALDAQFTGMQKLELHFPQLVKFAIKMANAVIAMGRRRGLGPECIMFDVPRWHPSGQVVVRMGLDPEGKRIITADKAAKNYSNLRQVNEDVPQAVELAMAIAFQLVPAVNAKKLNPRSIQISSPRFNEAETEMVFTIGIPRPEVDL